AADRNVVLTREFEQRRSVGRQIRRAIRVWNSQLKRGVGVDLTRRDFGIALAEAELEALYTLMDVGRAMENLGRAAPDHHGARDAGPLLELADVLHQHFGLFHFRAR